MNTLYRGRFLLLCLLLLPAVLQAQPVLQIKGYNKLYLLDLKSSAESLLYTSVYPEIRTAQVSHDGTLFALLETDYSNGAGGKNYLKAFNMQGTLLYEGQPDVRQYTWDPKSHRLAYITGSFNEDGVSFIPTGFYLKDFLSGKETRIDTEGFQPVALNWVNNATEDAIYVACVSDDKSKRFMRYDLVREKFETLPFKSIDVSPDSKFYVEHDVRCRCVKLFDRVTQVEHSRIALSETDIPVGWTYNTDHLFVVAKYAFEKEAIMVIDARNGRQIQSISGVLPSRPPYQSMFTKPDVILSLPRSAAENARQATGRPAITITTIPEQYRQ